jgi:hypothetical protein
MNKLQPLFPLIGSLLLVGVVVAFAYSFGLLGKPAAEPGEAVAAAGGPVLLPDRQVNLITAYLDPPVGGAHRIFLMNVFTESCRVSLDTSVSQPNELGDVLSSPDNATVLEVTLRPVATSSESARDSHLYDIVGVENVHLRLTTPTTNSSSYRLLEVDKDGNALRVVTMEPWRFAQARPSASGGGKRD